MVIDFENLRSDPGLGVTGVHDWVSTAVMPTGIQNVEDADRIRIIHLSAIRGSSFDVNRRYATLDWGKKTMAPEMAVAYVAGLIPSTLVSGAHLLLFKRRINSPPVRLLQNNLAEVGLYWSESSASIRECREGSAKRDEQLYLRGVKILGLGCFFLSWVGVFFHLLILLSLRYIAMPRLERALMRSSLATRSLSAEETRRALIEIQAQVMNARIPGV